MGSEYSYWLTDIAQDDFDNIIGYIVIKLSSPQAASSFADEMEGAMDELCRIPLKGSPVENPFLLHKGVRSIAVKQYIIYYLPDDEEKKIIILRISHSLQDQDRILRNI